MEERADESWAAIVEHICTQRDDTIQDTRTSLDKLGRESPVPLAGMRKLADSLGLHLHSAVVAEGLARMLIQGVPGKPSFGEWSEFQANLKVVLDDASPQVAKPLIIGLMNCPDWFWPYKTALRCLAAHWNKAWAQDQSIVKIIVELYTSSPNATNETILHLFDEVVKENPTLLAQEIWPETLQMLKQVEASHMPGQLAIFVDLLACRCPSEEIQVDDVAALIRSGMLHCERIIVKLEQFASKCIQHKRVGPEIWGLVFLDTKDNGLRRRLLQQLLAQYSTLSHTATMTALNLIQKELGEELFDEFCMFWDYVLHLSSVSDDILHSWGKLSAAISPQKTLNALRDRMKAVHASNPALDSTRLILLYGVKSGMLYSKQDASEWNLTWARQLWQRPRQNLVISIFQELLTLIDLAHAKRIHERTIAPLMESFGLVKLSKEGITYNLSHVTMVDRPLWQLFLSSLKRLRRPMGNCVIITDSISTVICRFLADMSILYPAEDFTPSSDNFHNATTWVKQLIETVRQVESQAGKRSEPVRKCLEVLGLPQRVAAWKAHRQLDDTGHALPIREDLAQLLCEQLFEDWKQQQELNDSHAELLSQVLIWLANETIAIPEGKSVWSCESCSVCSRVVREEHRLLILLCAILGMDCFEDLVCEHVKTDSLSIPDVFGLVFCRAELMFRRDRGFETLLNLGLLAQVVSNDAELKAAVRVANACFRTTSIIGMLAQDEAMELALSYLIGGLDPTQAPLWAAVLNVHRDGDSRSMGQIPMQLLARIVCMSMTAPFLRLSFPEESECSHVVIFSRIRSIVHNLLKIYRTRADVNSTRSNQEMSMTCALACVIATDLLREEFEILRKDKPGDKNKTLVEYNYVNNDELNHLLGATQEVLACFKAVDEDLSSFMEVKDALGIVIRAAEACAKILQDAHTTPEHEALAELQQSGLVLKLSQLKVPEH